MVLNEPGYTLSYSVSNSPSGIINTSMSGGVLNLNPVTDASGEVTVSVSVTGSGAKTITSLNKSKNNKKYTKKLTPKANKNIATTIKFVIGNLPPVLAKPLEDLNLDGNFDTYSVDLNNYFTDPNKDYLNFNITYNDQEISCYTDDEGILSINSIANWSGVSDVSINAADEEFNVSDDFQITVNEVAPAPYLTKEISDTTVTEDFEDIIIDLANHFTDPSGNEIEYNLLYDPEMLNCNIVNNILTIKSISNWNGYAPITIEIKDSEEKSLISRSINTTFNS